jgi:putative PIN family toxin of toxin-antitoxin system
VSSPVAPRVVFDTNIVLSALVFTNGRLAWLRSHWSGNRCVPLVSRATAAELARVLAYPKFKQPPDRRSELLGDYLPYCESIEKIEQCAISCRDAKDQIFLDLAQSGRADVLVSGDQDLLVLRGQTSFAIETPEAYRNRVL